MRIIGGGASLKSVEISDEFIWSKSFFSWWILYCSVNFMFLSSWAGLVICVCLRVCPFLINWLTLGNIIFQSISVFWVFDTLVILPPSFLCECKIFSFTSSAWWQLASCLRPQSLQKVPCLQRCFPFPVLYDAIYFSLCSVPSWFLGNFVSLWLFMPLFAIQSAVPCPGFGITRCLQLSSWTCYPSSDLIHHMKMHNTFQDWFTMAAHKV